MPVKVPTVWFVDDDEDDRLFTRTAFEEVSPPITVLTLNNGEQLLAELEDSGGVPKLILLDLNMPGLNGFDILRQLRSKSVYDSVPVVVFTTSSSEDDRQQSLLAGANGFLVKPASYAELYALAHELNQRWSLSEE